MSYAIMRSIYRLSLTKLSYLKRDQKLSCILALKIFIYLTRLTLSAYQELASGLI